MSQQTLGKENHIGKENHLKNVMKEWNQQNFGMKMMDTAGDVRIKKITMMIINHIMIMCMVVTLKEKQKEIKNQKQKEEKQENKSNAFKRLKIIKYSKKY